MHLTSEPSPQPHSPMFIFVFWRSELWSSSLCSKCLACWAIPLARCLMRYGCMGMGHLSLLSVRRLGGRIAGKGSGLKKAEKLPYPETLLKTQAAPHGTKGVEGKDWDVCRHMGNTRPTQSFPDVWGGSTILTLLHSFFLRTGERSHESLFLYLPPCQGDHYGQQKTMFS